MSEETTRGIYGFNNQKHNVTTTFPFVEQINTMGNKTKRLVEELKNEIKLDFLNKESKPILAIDFDGTIVEEGYPDIGKEKKNAKLVINALYKLGFTIIINTCRAGEHEINARKFLQERGIMYHYINENCPTRIERYDTDSRKISADLYIDDKNIWHNDDWLAIYQEVCKRFIGYTVELL